MKTKARTTKRKISIINLLSTIILLYILGSFFEVNIHNKLDADPLENPYNAFSLLSQAMENNWGGITMSNTTFASFTEILTSLYNGNRGEAQQTAEIIKYDNTADLSEESQRHKQYRANYEALRLKKYFEGITDY